MLHTQSCKSTELKGTTDPASSGILPIPPGLPVQALPGPCVLLQLMAAGSGRGLPPQPLHSCSFSASVPLSKMSFMIHPGIGLLYQTLSW